MNKTMSIIIEYDSDKFMEYEVIDSILKVGGGGFSIPYYIPITRFLSKNSFTLFCIQSFSRWILRECTKRCDSPFYINEYLHAMIDEWEDSSKLTYIIEESERKAESEEI